MLKFRKIISCIMAAAMLLGGNVMSTQAAQDKKQEQKFAHELDAQAYNGNDLGAAYTKEATTFKVWAPLAKRVAVKMYATGSSDEEGAADISTTTMTKGDRGVWEATVKGDQKNHYYTYLITTDGITIETNDVYSKAVGVNGNRSMVVDLASTNPDGWDKDKHILYDDPTDAVVWEVHIRDFSVSNVSGISDKNKGKFLAFTEKGTTLDGKGEIPTCVEYLKKLGVTHVQLLPVYDYATVDESKTDSEEYNWGYDPKNYNVPEGSYSTNPFDGNVRINEFKQMVKALHDAGIGVIMDVVYNHTYTAKGSCFENTVPGYYFRYKDDGSLSDGSGCGNETASDHLMYRKYMIDSVLYWANEYHIDGFRFDLMGVHDVDTMNEIRKALDTKVEGGKKIIMYGEPWTGGSTSTDAKTAVKDNVKLLDNRIGAFNDSFRDSVKGHVFNAQEGGFVQKASGSGAVKESIKGSSWLKQPSQSVTYISAHDNFTLYDKLIMSTKNDSSFDTRDESIVKMNKLAAAITLTSQGITFMQAGEDFARTKYGDENSYVSPDSINMLDWNCLVKYADLSSYYQGLIEIRKNFKPFRDPTAGSSSRIAFSDTGNDGVIAYTLSNELTADKEWAYAAVLFNATGSEQEVTLKKSGNKALPSTWEIIADGTQAGLKGLGTVEGDKVTIAPNSAMILTDKESFDKLNKASSVCSVTVEYVDDSSGNVIETQVLKGNEGEGFRAERCSDFDVDYDYVNTEGSDKGKFTKADQKVVYHYKKFTGNIYELKVNFLRKGDADFATGDSEMAPPVVTRMRENTQYIAQIKKIDGMRLDMDTFPSNAVGFATDNINVNYYYVTEPVSDLVIHYYDPDKWSKAYAYLYSENDEGEKEEFAGGEPGTEMQADSELGEGWYTLTVKGKGSNEDIKAVFSDGDKNSDTTIYTVTNEAWIQNGAVNFKGEVNVIYLDNAGTILAMDKITGKEGSEYKAEQKSFDSCEFLNASTNVSGKLSRSVSYAFYVYKSPNAPVPEVPSNNEDDNKGIVTVIAIILGASLLTFVGAGIIGHIYNKRKNRWNI